MDAYQLVSQTALTPIANVVDTNYTVVAKVAKSVPEGRDRDGRHARPVAPLSESLTSGYIAVDLDLTSRAGGGVTEGFALGFGWAMFALLLLALAFFLLRGPR